MNINERVAMRVAWWLPRRIAYWCSVRLMAAATQGCYSGQVVPELTCMDALERWEISQGEELQGKPTGAELVRYGVSPDKILSVLNIRPWKHGK